MTQKRKAELQRKLSMAPVAKPPSDLADRIKATIPDYLDARHDRERLSRSIGFSLRVAASIILLVASTFIAVEFLSRSETGAIPEAVPATKSVIADAQPQPEAFAVPAEPVAQMEEVAPKDEPRRQERVVARLSRPARPRGAESEGKVAAAPPPPATPVPPPAAPLPDPVRQADLAEAAAEVAMDAVQTTAAAPAQAPVLTAPQAAESRVALSSANFSVRREGAAEQEKEVDRLKKLLRDGEKPAAVNVEAVVDHFAGPPARGLRDIHLEVEASRAPLASDQAAVIRYTIDVPSVNRSRGLQAVKLSIVVEKAVIDSYRKISGVQPSSEANKLLQSGTSVTGLVEVRLLPHIAPDQRVATIVLDYVSVAGGKRTRDTHPVHARDLDRSWQSTSRRHRLATLSAKWSESLSTSSAATGVAEAAAQLAEEAPGDERAQELATLTASSRPRTSSPTGSGR